LHRGGGRRKVLLLGEKKLRLKDGRKEVKHMRFLRKIGGAGRLHFFSSKKKAFASVSREASQIYYIVEREGVLLILLWGLPKASSFLF